MRQHVHKCNVVNASVDWITCTASTKDAQSALWQVGQRVLNRNESEGEHTSRWHAHGYEGWTNGHVALAGRKDGCILRISGQEASNQWHKAFRAAENCSRLDLAVDCYFDPPMLELSRQIYRDASHVKPVNGRSPTRSLIVSGDGGSTVYIGARASEQYGRVYDKGIEAKMAPAGVWWRWEVEYKGGHSYALGDVLSRTDDHRVAIVSNVAHWFRTRTTHSYTSTDGFSSILLSRDPTSVDRALSWLSRGVRPTVQRLIDVVGRDRVLSALGLHPQSVGAGLEPSTTHKECA